MLNLQLGNQQQRPLDSSWWSMGQLKENCRTGADRVTELGKTFNMSMLATKWTLHSWTNGSGYPGLVQQCNIYVTYICIYITFVQMDGWMDGQMDRQIDSQLVSQLEIYIYTQVHIYRYTYIQIYIYNFIHIYIYTYIHLYIYIHI